MVNTGSANEVGRAHSKPIPSSQETSTNKLPGLKSPSSWRVTNTSGASVFCILQNTDAPLVFVTRHELGLFKPGSLFVDVSCDEGMGFEWARPTSFADPVFTIAPGVYNYEI